jgi:hypothetical protein
LKKWIVEYVFEEQNRINIFIYPPGIYNLINDDENPHDVTTTVEIPIISGSFEICYMGSELCEDWE